VAASALFAASTACEASSGRNVLASQEIGSAVVWGSATRLDARPTTSFAAIAALDLGAGALLEAAQSFDAEADLGPFGGRDLFVGLILEANASFVGGVLQTIVVPVVVRGLAMNVVVVRGFARRRAPVRGNVRAVATTSGKIRK
jgi:hypothetical protein